MLHSQLSVMDSTASDDASQSWNVFELPSRPPEESSLEAIAHRILGYKDDTQLRILYAVGDGPKRFKELRERTEKPDGQLTRALGALHDEGLLVERVGAREQPAVKTHDLSPRGVLVLDLVQRLHEAAESDPFELKTAEGTYVLYSRIEEMEDGTRQRRYFFVQKGATPDDARPSPAPPKGRVEIDEDGTPRLAKV